MMLHHCAELVGVLLFMTVGHGVLDLAPHVVTRVARSFILWLIVFGAAVLVLWVPPLAASIVRIGMVLLVAYGAWWLVAIVVEFFRGPYLLQPPRTSDLGEAVQQVTGLAARSCRRLARRVLKRHDAYVAFLGLGMTTAQTNSGETAFRETWLDACERALASVRELAGRYGGRSGGRIRARDAQFLAQALCLYERESVERAFGKRSLT